MGSIVWLASYPKSGNTWLRVFLANLIAGGRGPVPLSELPLYCEDEARPELWAALAGRPNTELDLSELAALRPRVHAWIASQAAGTRLVKTHNRAGTFDGRPLHNMTVTAGAVYIVRNPLDVAVSMTHHFGLTPDEAIDRLGNDRVATENNALFVSQILGSWSQHVKSWADIPSERVIILRYEDLLAKPVKQFARAARLLGLAGHRAGIERAVRHSTFDTLASMERRHGFVEASEKGARFFRRGRMNQWHDILGREQVQRLIDSHREQMARFRYLPPGY